MPPARASTARSLPRGLLVLVAVLLVARVAGLLYERHHPSQPNSLLVWYPLDEARARSLEKNRPILYDFTAEWCEPCHELERQIFNDEEAARLINDAYVPVRVIDRMREDGENPPEVEALMTQYEVAGFPSLVFALPGQKKPRSLSGYRGYSETLEFLLLPSPRGFVPQKFKKAPEKTPEKAPETPAPAPAAPAPGAP